MTFHDKMSRNSMTNKPRKASLLHLLSWILYDWGHSAFSAIVQTFIFAAYFTKQVSFNTIEGTIIWGYVNAAAAFAVGLAAPILGAIADNGHNQKVWLFVFTYICIFFTCLLWFIQPEPAYSYPALLMFAFAVIGSELAFVFYNALLPAISPPGSIGKWSGFGWSCGFAGGVASLLACLTFFVNEEFWDPSSKASAYPVRATFLLAGMWLAIFSAPLFIFVPGGKGNGKSLIEAVQGGWSALKFTLKNIMRYRPILIFLIARNFFMDGLTTLFVFGGVYAASLAGMNEEEILYFGILTNISSALGSAIFGYIDDLIGGKRTILLSLLGLLVTTSGILFTKSPAGFWIIGFTLGLFIGPVQSGCRSYMARIAPEHLRNEMFGFLALSGKATSFLGPFLVGWIVSVTRNVRAGVWVVLVHFLIGFLLMLTVKNERDIEFEGKHS